MQGAHKCHGADVQVRGQIGDFLTTHHEEPEIKLGTPGLEVCATNLLELSHQLIRTPFLVLNAVIKYFLMILEKKPTNLNDDSYFSK